MMKPYKLRVRRYSAHSIELNELLAIFIWSKASEKIREIELNEILFHGIPND